MGVVLTQGGNVSLGELAPAAGTVLVGLGWSAAEGCELDASALLCDHAGRSSDQNFVFFNNVRSPDGSVRHRGPAAAGSADREQIEVDLAAVPGEVRKIAFAVAVYDAAQRGQTFGQVHSAHIRLLDPAGEAELARYDLPRAAAGESAMVFGELYRHGGGWKFRAVGQGYASGLAGIAADFGVRVLQPAAEPSTPPPSPAPVRPSVRCFFDPAHGASSSTVLWSPQWGAAREVHACAACAQRVLTTPPPFYAPPQHVSAQAGYPQPVQAGYPPAGGHPQPAGPDHGRRFGAGALIGAGAAGILGGILLDEALSDDEPRVVVNNYYEDEDDDFF
ncbi:TerD family protein [Kitasatospora sp. GAS1066B]|uniref:TerD family protein n=1 Tax=Kitasatospora sp. GAS1066B TaxID=3156271 RepID=UPI0035159D1C